MTLYEISLEEKDNPEFYSLGKEYNSLIGRLNDYNSQLHKFKVPRLFLFKTKHKLISIGRNIAKLQKDFLDWQKRAHNFCIEPHYKVDPKKSGSLIYLHFTATMRDLVNRLDSNMTLLANNYQDVYSQYQNQVNFLIAIIAFIVSFIGLLLGIITFTK